jgi:hypothetical protein
VWLRAGSRKVESYLVDFLKIMATKEGRQVKKIHLSCPVTQTFSDPNLPDEVIAYYITLWL